MSDKFPNNKFFRRVALIWAMSLVTIIVVWTWLDTPEISGGTAAALGTVVGILATVIGHYQWSREKDDKREIQNVADRGRGSADATDHHRRTVLGATGADREDSNTES